MIPGVLSCDVLAWRDPRGFVALVASEFAARAGTRQRPALAQV